MMGDTSASARGRSARSKGHAFERAVANYLSAVSGDDVVTARSISGGMQHGTDLLVKVGGTAVEPHWRGFQIECKDWDRSMVPTWLDQASNEDNLFPGVVVEKVRRQPIHKANVHLYVGDLTFLLGRVVRHPDAYATVPLWLFAELAMKQWRQ